MLTNVTVLKTQYWRFPFEANNTADYGKHPRGAIATKLDFGGKRLWHVNVHLEPANAVAMRQVWEVVRNVKTFDPDFPVILAGDFNIRNYAPRTGTPDQTYHTMDTVLGWAGFRDVSLHRNTALLKPPSLALDGQLDYIYLYDPHRRLTVLSCQARYVAAPPLVFCDHLALVAKFRWR